MVVRTGRRANLPGLLRALLGRCALFAALLTALQLCGLGHTLVDAVDLLAGHSVSHEPSCDSDDRCPPACPSCHCCARAGATSPQTFSCELTLLPPGGLLLRDSAAVRRPHNPPRAPLYRPPRSFVG